MRALGWTRHTVPGFASDCDLVGKGGWLDRREVRFYLACFALVCLLVILMTWSFDAAGVLFVILAGFGPVFWRLLV